MNYEFPTIRNIADVLPAIEGRDEFVVAVKDGYTVINYNVQFEDTFPSVNEIIEYDGNSPSSMGIAMANWDSVKAAIRRECRGIIFDNETGNILRRPYHKFFNVNERPETQDHTINLSNSHKIMEKLDGSMIVPFMVGNRMIWGTKMGETDVAKPVEEFVNTNSQYKMFAKWMFSMNMSPIFEWCSRKQRIVIDHPEDRLVLTAIRHLYDGHYVNHESLVGFAHDGNIPVVDIFDPATDMNAFIETTRGLTDTEGFVIRFDDGHMLKLKCDWYCQIHKAKEKILQDRNIVELILDEKLDDIKAHLPEEDRDRLTKFESDFNHEISATVSIINQLLNAADYVGIDRKTFALEYAVDMDGLTRAIYFKCWDDRQIETIRTAVLNTIRNNLGRTVKYEAIRDAWFSGVTFNEF